MTDQEKLWQHAQILFMRVVLECMVTLLQYAGSKRLDLFDTARQNASNIGKFKVLLAQYEKKYL